MSFGGRLDPGKSEPLAVTLNRIFTLFVCFPFQNLSGSSAFTQGASNVIYPGATIADNAIIGNSNIIDSTAVLKTSVQIGDSNHITGTIGGSSKLLNSNTVAIKAEVGTGAAIGSSNIIRCIIGSNVQMGNSATLDASCRLGNDVCVENNAVPPNGSQVLDRGMINAAGIVFPPPPNGGRYTNQGGVCLQ